MNYAEFIASKQFQTPALGIDPPETMPSYLKPFQADITRWAMKRGRAAIFASTGLGKTRMELCWADHVQRSTGLPVLFLMPLAVAEQTIAEAGKIGIDGIAYAEDQSRATSRIVVTNYDRMERFDYVEFGAVVMDESSIIKSHDSKTRKFLIDACREVPYLLPATATPAPNDYVELGNHAELLGVMSQKEMLAMFFVHEGSVRANEDAAEWRLKRHAERDFWKWLASWSVVVRHPRDLGYDEPGYDLPRMHKHQVTVRAEAEPLPGELFARDAKTLSERIATRRSTIDVRVKAAADLIAAEPDESWIIWCGLNDEAEAIRRAVDGIVEVRGSDDRAVKAERLLGFASGKYRRLATKSSIAGHGLNLQICAREIFLGMNDSFEGLYQAIRRCWRFGQSREVHAYLIASDLEGAVVKNLNTKETAFDNMYASMAEHMADLTVRNIRGGRVSTDYQQARTLMETPVWLVA